MSVVLSNRQAYANSFNLLRFPLALMVVLVHVFSVTPSSFNIAGVSDNYSFEMVCRFIQSFIIGIPVPVYFFISGYLFFREPSFTSGMYKSKLMNRLHSLLIPYIIWNSLAIAAILLKNLPIFSALLSYNGTEVDVDIRNVLSCFWEYNGKLSPPPSDVENYELFIRPTPYPINTALWYIRDLMIIVIFSPLVFRLTNRLGAFFVGALAVIYLLIPFTPANTHLGQLITGFFFFSWGALFSINKKDSSVFFNKWLWPVLFIFNALICLIYYDSHPQLSLAMKQVNSIVAIPILFYTADLLMKNNTLKLSPKLLGFSVFLYVSHCIITARFTKLLIMIIHPIKGYEVTLVYAIAFVSVVLLLYLSYILLHRFMPRLLSVTIGGK